MQGTENCQELEPGESDDVTITSRNEACIEAAGGPTDLPESYIDENGMGKTWKECKDAYVAMRREEDSYGGTTTSKRVAAQQHYRECMDLSRITRREWGEDRSIALVSLRISPTLDGGYYLPPKTMVRELVEAYSKAWNKLTYQLNKRGIEREYFRVVAGTDMGSPHIHLVMFANDALKEEYFQNFCSSFVDNCKFAEEATNLPSEGAVEILEEGSFEYEHYDSDQGKGPVDPFTRYASTQIPHQGYVSSSTQAELYHGATMYASSKSACTKSRCVEKDAIESEEEGGDTRKSIRVALTEKSLTPIRGYDHLPRTIPSPVTPSLRWKTPPPIDGIRSSPPTSILG